MGAHLVQPYPPRKMAPARLHLGATSGRGEASFCVLMSEPRGGQTNRKRPQLVGGGGWTHHQPGIQGLPLSC